MYQNELSSQQQQNIFSMQQQQQTQQQQQQQQNALNSQQFCYTTNCYVVNIDGPINFNSTHSLLDDGADLPLNDINTMRFFYNLGIEV